MGCSPAGIIVRLDLFSRGMEWFRWLLFGAVMTLPGGTSSSCTVVECCGTVVARVCCCSDAGLRREYVSWRSMCLVALLDHLVGFWLGVDDNECDVTLPG